MAEFTCYLKNVSSENGSDAGTTGRESWRPAGNNYAPGKGTVQPFFKTCRRYFQSVGRID